MRGRHSTGQEHEAVGRQRLTSQDWEEGSGGSGSLRRLGRPGLHVLGPGRSWTVCKEGGPGHGVPTKDKSTNPLSGGGGRTHPVLPLGRGGWGKRWRKAAVGAWPTGPPSFLKETGGAGKTPDRMGRVQFSPRLSAFLGGEGKGLFYGGVCAGVSMAMC